MTFDLGKIIDCQLPKITITNHFLLITSFVANLILIDWNHAEICVSKKSPDCQGFIKYLFWINVQRVLGKYQHPSKLQRQQD